MQPDEQSAVRDAVAWLGEAGLVGYPTETVWGLAADARSERALDRLRRWKGRDAAHPMSLLVPGVESLDALGWALPAAARALAERFWPGPLTLVVPGPARAGLATGVARADGALGLRCSPHPQAAALAREALRAGVGPLTSTSLNRSGRPPARTRAEAERICAPGGPRLLACGEAGGGAPSTVLDLTGERPRVLRVGALAAAVLLETAA